MIILDTNVISELMKPKGSEKVYQWVAEQPMTELFTTTITQAEILYGLALLPAGKRREQLSKTAKIMFNEDFAGRILTFDQQAAIAFAKIASERRQKGIPISQADAQIAAICSAQKATLATRNVSDFVNCGIVIINPWESEKTALSRLWCKLLFLLHFTPYCPLPKSDKFCLSP